MAPYIVDSEVESIQKQLAGYRFDQDHGKHQHHKSGQRHHHHHHHHHQHSIVSPLSSTSGSHSSKHSSSSSTATFKPHEHATPRNRPSASSDSLSRKAIQKSLDAKLLANGDAADDDSADERASHISHGGSAALLHARQRSKRHQGPGSKLPPLEERSEVAGVRRIEDPAVIQVTLSSDSESDRDSVPRKGLKHPRFGTKAAEKKHAHGSSSSALHSSPAAYKQARDEVERHHGRTVYRIV